MVVCKNCANINTTLSIQKNGFSYYSCNNCHITFLHHNFKYDKFVKNFYTRGYFEGDTKLSAYNDYKKNKKIIRRNFKPIIDQIRALQPNNGRHLDVGCAYGFFLELTKEAGFEVHGVEPSIHAVNFARRKFGGRIIHTTFEKAKLPKDYFSFVSMFDVLEHIQNPVGALKKAANLLTPGGILAISTGDQTSLFARLCGSNWHFYNPPQHLFIFPKDFLISSLVKFNLFPFMISKKGKFFSLAYLLHLARTIYKNRFADFLYNLIDNSPLANLPIYLRFNDTIVVYARKV